VEEIVKIEYPKELLQIQVLDDSTDDTAPFAGALVERYRALGYRSNIITAPTAMDSRRERCRKASKPPPANSSPCSTPIFARRPTS